MKNKYPRFVRIDASVVCQLKCPLCPTGRRLPGVGWEHLKFSRFKKFIDDNPFIRRIELANYGEVFLNPELAEIIRYGTAKKITLEIGSGANLNYASERALEELVRCKIRVLTVSIDGASQETYEKYRVGGKFRDVLDNVKKINVFKQRYRSSWPQMTWKFIVFGHNEHEIETARSMAADLNMNFLLQVSWKPEWSPTHSQGYMDRNFRNVASSKNKDEAVHRLSSVSFCEQMWNSPQINSDGRMLGCCVNHHMGDYGNVFEEGFIEVLESERYRYAKEMLRGRQPERADIPCVACRHYKEMKLNQRWMEFDVETMKAFAPVVRVKTVID